MSTLTVEAVSADEPRQWNSTKGGPMLAYKVKFKEHADKIVEWSRKQSSDAPSPGQQVEGTIDWEAQFGPRFKQDFSQAGGGGGYKPRDPKETAAIQWQHSQDMSIQTVRLACDLGLLKPKSSAELFDVIDKATERFHRNIDRSASLVAYGESQQKELPRKDPEPTGVSDVPADGDGFKHRETVPASASEDIPFLREPDRTYEQVKCHASRW